MRVESSIIHWSPDLVELRITYAPQNTRRDEEEARPEDREGPPKKKQRPRAKKLTIEQLICFSGLLENILFFSIPFTAAIVSPEVFLSTQTLIVCFQVCFLVKIRKCFAGF